MLKPKFTSQFKKDYKLAIRRGCNPEEIQTVIRLLCGEKPMPRIYLDHPLQNSRNYVNMRECHINPDWLLIYQIDRDELLLKLIRTGSHSDLY